MYRLREKIGRFALAWQPRSHKLQNRSFIHSLKREQKKKIMFHQKISLSHWMFALELDINWSTLQSNAFKISNRGKLMMRFMLQSWKPQDNKLCYCYNIACSLAAATVSTLMHYETFLRISTCNVRDNFQEIGNANFTPHRTLSSLWFILQKKSAVCRRIYLIVLCLAPYYSCAKWILTYARKC